MRLSTLSGLVVESIQTDFYDVYLLAGLPGVLDDPEAKALFVDRVDRLYDEILWKFYFGLLLRIDSVGAFGSSLYGDFPASFDAAKQITDPAEMRRIIATSHRVDTQLLWQKTEDMTKHRRGTPEWKALWAIPCGAWGGSWDGIVETFINMTRPPADHWAKLYKLDSFFGMAHNNGALVDYLMLPWLFDALYVRALADPNELAQHASIDVQRATRLNRPQLGYRPVTDTDKLALFQAKQARHPKRNIGPEHSKPPAWLPRRRG